MSISSMPFYNHRSSDTVSKATLFPPRSNPSVPFVIDIIFPISAFAALDAREAVDRLDPLDIFRLLEAELPFDPEAERGAVGDRQQMAVQAPGDQRLRV